MSPEQARGEEVDERADLFAFGAVLYEMATGRRAFPGATTAIVFDALLNREPHLASGLNPQVPAKLEGILAKALRKKVQQRYQSAASMLMGLKELKREVEAGQGGTTDPAEEIARRSSGFLDSVAVLPFDNVGHDPDMEYLSDGVTETIINSLSQLEQLRVIPRATMFRYKGKEFDTAGIRRELGVRLVLTGRVFQRGEQLIVGAELIDTARESQIWGEKYDRRRDDIFVVQEDIAQEIVSKLQLRLSDNDTQRLTRRPTENREAYDLFLRATYHANKWTAEGLQKGIDYSRKAIEVDPAYAAPYVGLAYIYTMLGFFGMVPPIDAFPRAKAASIKALEIEESIAAAHTMLGMVRLLYEWDWAEAERDIQRALRLAPNQANGRYAHGIWLLAMRRCEEAITEIGRALDIDPLCSHINYSLGLAYYWDRQYHRAIEQLQKTVELEPSFIVAQQVLALTYARKGMYTAALEQSAKVLVLFGSDFRGHATAALVHAIAGQPPEARRILEELRDRSSQASATTKGIRAVDLARVYAQLGENDQALEKLWEAFRERASLLLFLRYTPEFDCLVGDPRFDDLLNRVGLPRGHTT